MFWFVVSTIMNSFIFKTMMKFLKFDDKLVFIKTFINRKNVFINVQKIQKIFVFFENFRFLINTNSNIKFIKRKIVVYDNTIVEFFKMIDVLRRFYKKTSKCDEEIANQHIRLYHEKLFLSKKSILQTDFKRENFDIRIICFIEILNMNMNIFDIDIVIQWKKSSLMRELWQRAKKVARASNLSNEFLWFYFFWTKKNLDHEITKNSTIQVENAKNDSLVFD